MANVIKAFTDKGTGKIYLVGDTYAGSAERVAELAKGGYVDAPKAAPAKKVAPKRKAAK